MTPRFAGLALAAGLALSLAACASAPTPRPVWSVVSETVASASGAAAAGSGPALADAVARLLAGEKSVPEGWQLVPLSDVADGQALAESRRPPSDAGVVAVRGRGAKPVGIAVPLTGGAGPNEKLGTDLFVRSHAAVLVVAGSPTGAAASDAPFRAVTGALADRGLVLVVVEGFTADADPASPEVVLQGATDVPSDEELLVGTLLQQAEVDSCVRVAEECIDPNVALEQGQDAEAGPVVRVQLAGRLAADTARRETVLGEVAKALDEV